MSLSQTNLYKGIEVVERFTVNFTTPLDPS